MQDVDCSLELDSVPTEPLIDDTTLLTTQDVTGAVSNRIVLGQKPSSVPNTAIESDEGCMDEEELLKCYSATVLLDDWGPYLEGSDSYCKECEILFATVNALDAHKMIAHSFLVAVESKELVEESNAAQEPKKVCFVCQKSFVTDDDLIKHIYHHVSTKEECKQCHETFLSKKLLTDHMMMMHTEAEPSRSKVVKKPTDIAYKCKKCSRSYTSFLVINTHLRKFHGRVYPTASDYDVVDRLKGCVSGKISDGKVAIEHKEAPKSQGSSSAKSNSQEPLSVPESREFVPKNTLFYCTDCDVHFLSLSVAISHKKTCPKIESVDCQKCPLTIASECMESHQFQHKLTENASFDVLDVDTKFLKTKLLCVCPKCKEFCSFRFLWSHVSDCSVGRSYHCVPCDIYLHEDSAYDHRFAHDAYRLEKDDFIIIEYVKLPTVKTEVKKQAVENVITVGKKRKLEDVKSVSMKAPKDTSKTIDCEFFYCRSCHFFLPKSGAVKRNSHIAGLCSSQVKRVCFTCGLVMTNSSIAHHHRLHHRPGFTFDNFKFFDIHSNVEIQPPIPEYPQCRKCKCCFLQIKTALKHSCPAKDTITCDKCNGKFSQVAYNMHKNFHVKRNLVKTNNLRTYKPAKKLKNQGLKPNAEIVPSSEIDDKEASKQRKEIAPKKVCESASKGVAKFTNKPKPDVRESENEAMEAESESEDTTRAIYYCLSCKCCFRTAKGHKDQAGSCYAPETIQKRKRTCKHCGLILTPPMIDAHLKTHEVQGMTLKDFRFKNFGEIPFLTPPLPVYYPCEKCDVTFHTLRDRRFHECEYGSAHVECEYCGGRFSEAAYRLHVEFHRVGVAESSRDFLVAQCMGCARIFSKSQVSQSNFRHSCSQPKDSSTYIFCEVCKLTVNRWFFAAHTAGHGRTKIVLFDPKVKKRVKKDKFVMLHCGACKQIFGIGIDNGHACPECGLELTVWQKSVITEPPASKLDTAKISGTAKLAAKQLNKRLFGKRYLFYQCSHCKETMKQKKNIERHVLLHCGPNKKTFRPRVLCKICSLWINKAKSYHGHVKLHKRFPSIRKDNIDIIQCKKTSKKVEFGERKAHIIKSKEAKITGPSKEKAQMKKKKKVKTIRKKYKYYHCRNCLSAIRTLPHTCSSENGRVKRLVKCRLCNLNISLNHYKKHREFHSEHPDLVPENIALVPIGERKGKVTTVTVTMKEAKRLLYLFKSKATNSTSTETDDDSSADVPDVATEEQEEKVVSGDPTSDTEEDAHLGEVDGSSDAKYTFYRCNKCLGCVSSAKKAEEHELFNGCASWKKNHCEECGLDFVLRFIQGHTLKHRQNPEMTKDSIRIVKFGEASKSPEPSPRRKFVLYQCAECLICYEAQCEHVCETVKRRTCDICQYDFQASHFRKHTECHKNDNYQRSAIKILPLESKAEEESDMDVTPQRKRRHDGELTKTVDVYKCNCGLHFLNQKSLNKHELGCKGVDEEPKGLQCSKCDLVFDPTQLVKHSIVHHGNLDCNLKYNVIGSVGKDNQCTVCDTEFRKGEQCPTCDPESVQKDKATVSCPKCRQAVPQSLLLHHLLSHKVQKRQHNDHKADVKCYKCHAKYAKGGECQNCETEKEKSKEEIKVARRQAYGRAQVSCPKCGLSMRRSSLHRHLRRHALSEKNNKVISSKMQKNKRVAKGKKLVGHNKAKVKATGSKDTTKVKQNNVKVDTNVVKKDNTAKVMDSPVKTDKTEKGNRMFNCDDCNVHFISKTVFEAHKKKRKHVAPFVQCMVCKLNIYQEEIAAHLKDHHCTRQYSKVLYRCPICRVHFLKQSLLTCHLRRHKMIPPEICPKCDLAFNKSSIKKHIAMHHDVMNYEREDFVIKNARGNVMDIDNETNRGDDVAIENDESVNGDAESDLETGGLDVQETEVNKETSNVKVSSKSVENEAETEVERSTEADLSRKKTEEVLKDDGEDAKKEKSKLEDDAKASEKDKDDSFEPVEKGLKRCRKGITYYKCVECNVHFMKLQNIQKHLVRHKPLDELEFIECKLCKLNIKLNSVRTHMEHHKNKSFSLDKVLFINYVRKSKLIKSPEKPVAESVKVKAVEEINETVVHSGVDKDTDLTTDVLDIKEGAKTNDLNPDKVIDAITDIADKEDLPTHILGIHKVTDDVLESTSNELAIDIVSDDIVDEMSMESDDILNISTDSDDPMILGL